MNTFCTITTKSHLFKTFALANSIEKFDGKLKVLITDSTKIIEAKDIPANVELYFLKALNSERATQTIKKYKNNKLRWALKPVFLLFLLKEYEKVIYVDNDIYFYNDYAFLFNELDDSAVLLTPHFYPANPKKNQTWLEANLRIGLYNAGFIGTNKNAIAALKWWSDCCLYEMKKSFWRGLFDDQKYLDLLPVLFEGVKIIKDRGCNFAGWNSHFNLAVNKIIFIHFNSYTLKKFKKVSNKYHPLFKQYVERLKLFRTNFKENNKGLSLFNIINGLYFLKWKLARLITKT